MKSRVLPLVWGAVVALTSARGYAADVPDIADLSIEQLMDLDIESVYGASRYDQRVTQAPSSISIVTAEEIRRFGYTSFADVLRSVRGLYVSNDRNYTYLGIRGFNRPGDYNTRVLVLVDGHRLNDNVYDSGSVDRDAMLDVELIDRVEVIRGPSSSVYGSSAFFGVINVVTKHGAQFNGTEVAQDAGSLNTYQTRITYGDAFANGVDWLVSASHYSSDGDAKLYYPEFDQNISSDARARDNGLAFGLDDEEAEKFFTSMRLGGFTASAYYSERSKQVPTASFDAIFGDPDNTTLDKRGYIDLTWDGELVQGWRYRARGFYDHYTYAGKTPLDYASPGDPTDRVIFRDAALGEWAGAEMQLTGNLSDRYAFAVGSEYRTNLRADQVSYDDVQPRRYYLDDRSSSAVLGVFAQVETTLRDDLRVTTGLRYDRYSDEVGSTLNPRIAAIYNPSSRSAVKLLYGEAFRAPNPYERYYFTDVQQSRAPLKPETIRTYELVYEHYLDSRYHLNLSAYRYRIHGLISQAETAAGEPYYDNVDAVSARGIEVELEGKYSSGVHARASYILQRADDDTTGRELTSSPHQLAKLNVSVPVWMSALFASVELQYHSKSRTLAGATSPGFLLTNLNVSSTTLWPRVEVSAAIDNVFNATVVYPAAEEHLQDTLGLNGRTYQGKFIVRF
jgi:iron complex outermembrane receptor protein